MTDARLTKSVTVHISRGVHGEYVGSGCFLMGYGVRWWGICGEWVFSDGLRCTVVGNMVVLLQYTCGGRGVPLTVQ